MIGAIVGDIIGSKYEFNHIVKRNKHFPIFDRDGLFENDTWLTDDSIGSLAGAYYGVPEKFKRATALRIRNLRYPDKLEFLAFWLKRSLGFDIYAYA